MQQLGYNRQDAPQPGLRVDGAEVARQLDRMLTSAEFVNSGRMSRFLRYVVEATLAGDEAALKESSVGVAVFDRAPSYNPKTDPVVRSEARRLRDKIQRYYAGEGRPDPLRIDLPKGGYVATVRRVQVEETTPDASELLAESTESLAATESIADDEVSTRATVRPFSLARHLSRWLAAAGIAGLLLVLMWERRHSGGPSFVPAKVYPVTSQVGRELNASVSPDGSRVAFVSDQQSGNYDLFVVARGASSVPQRLTDTPEREMHPAFSPDGTSIAFLRSSPESSEVWTMDADGRNAKRVTEIHWFEWFNWRSDPLLSGGDPGPAWTPDGRSLILSDVAGSQQGSSLWEVEVATGARRQITRPQDLAHDFFPSVSRNGKHIAFVRQFSASICDLFVVDRETGAERRLTNEGRDIRGVTWMSDSKTVVYASSRTGVFQLWRLSVFELGEPVPIATAGDMVHDPSVSADGKLLVYTNATVNINLWRYRLDGGEAAQPLISSSGRNRFPRYSPDGGQIAWASDRTSGWEIWVADADGRNQRPVTSLSGRSSSRLLGTPRWSPDGRWIAFDARETSHSAIYLVSVTGGEPRLLEQNSWEERNPSFSRDGRWIYFNSNRGGTVQIWKRPVQGGQPVRVTTRKGYDCMEAPDGRTVYFVPAMAEPGIWRASPDGGDERVLLPTAPFYTRRQWDMAGGRLYFLSDEPRSGSILRYEPTGSTTDLVRTLEHEAVDGNSIAISPDERWAVVAHPDVMKSDLMTIEFR